MPQAVIDASFALSWAAPDEQASLDARGILAALHGGEIRLLAPSLWEYEVANALRMGVARKRLTEEEASKALRWLLDLGINLRGFGPICHRAWELALEHDLAVYDAAYLALAEQRRCPLYTNDTRLAHAARRVGLMGHLGEGG
ncbi:MAG: type II toxin-antitoxin system VapC family toxin [Armatimonadota bacterium]|jgi:predicted nucleic acid-binding protein